MKKNEHLVEDLHRFVELDIPQERGQVLKEINQQLCVHGPTLEDISALNTQQNNNNNIVYYEIKQVFILRES